ncbi:hypothetical protein VHUM_03321 [Vanrija humicola]|uniref:Mitochondrial intermediate peptidase 1 n=1 Tax=Vanrija humicola TaxID=5417 RepID=A0A7D8UXM8_VANHU|nr:hypothetical protein VHUM_03321 [Vanrija humicola]
MRPALATLRARVALPARPLSTTPSLGNRLATATATFAKPVPVAPVSSAAAADSDVRELFDTPYAPGTAAPSGLFGYPVLTSPEALEPLTYRTLVHARAIVDRIARAQDDPTGRELRLVVKNLDRLSDLLCGVIDMCELVRNAHPSPEWVAAADETYEALCSYMNELNTSRGLFDALVATLAAPHDPPLSHAERQVALTFLRDFEKSGIDLAPDVRARFVELSDSLMTLGRRFLSAATTGPNPSPPIEIPDPERLLDSLGPQFYNTLKRSWRGAALVTPGSWEAQMIARYARDGEARRLVYVGNSRADPERVGVLEEMLAQRAELAGVLGKKNWAEVALVDKMAKTPENVQGFLESLAEHHRATALSDVAMLQAIKSASITGIEVSGDPEKTKLQPLYAWDRDIYTERYISSLAPASLEPLAPFFSTGTVMRGLSRLFSRLYGISFRPAPVAPGEVWHPSVRRLDVVDESEGVIGVIYCDLFSREGKPASGAAHYTVRCSRRVDDDDLRGDGLVDGWDASFGPGLETAGDAIPGREGRYQLPIVVLTTDFGSVERDRPALLGWHEVETLFHEMGHAMHSMIGRTEYHNVSGTRCATDFVELPSILMEHFVSSPEVLSLFAEHYATGAPLPMELLAAHRRLQQSLAALETHGQIVMAMLDQQYHSLAPGGAVDSTAVHNALQNRVGVVPAVEGTAWQTQFGHLQGYGATYYSYLFDRAIAGKVFETLFAADPLSRDGGDVLKTKLLKWGGGRDPWEMVGDVVGGEEGEAVAKGDERAMGLVGGWYIK